MPARITPSGPLPQLANQFIEAAADPTTLTQLLRRSTENPETECIIWQGGTATGGRYGITTVSGETQFVHRASFAAFYGNVPAGSIFHESESTEIHHRCTNRLCMNPNHLEALTRREHNAEHMSLRQAA